MTLVFVSVQTPQTASMMSVMLASSAYVDTDLSSAYADGVEPVRDIAEDAASTDPGTASAR